MDCRVMLGRIRYWVTELQHNEEFLKKETDLDIE